MYSPYNTGTANPYYPQQTNKSHTGLLQERVKGGIKYGY